MISNEEQLHMNKEAYIELHYIRKTMKITPYQMSEIIGLAPKRINRIMGETTNVTLEEMEKIKAPGKWRFYSWFLQEINQQFKMSLKQISCVLDINLGQIERLFEHKGPFSLEDKDLKNIQKLFLSKSQCRVPENSKRFSRWKSRFQRMDLDEESAETILGMRKELEFLVQIFGTTTFLSKMANIPPGALSQLLNKPETEINPVYLDKINQIYQRIINEEVVSHAFY